MKTRVSDKRACLRNWLKLKSVRKYFCYPDIFRDLPLCRTRIYTVKLCRKAIVSWRDHRGWLFRVIYDFQTDLYRERVSFLWLLSDRPSKIQHFIFYIILLRYTFTVYNLTFYILVLDTKNISTNPDPILLLETCSLRTAGTFYGLERPTLDYEKVRFSEVAVNMN